MKNIFIMQGFLSLGNALVGIFYPFLVMEVFSLSFAQILFVVGIEYGLMGIFVYPIHRIRKISLQRKLGIGILFLFLSMVLLSILEYFSIFLLFSSLFYWGALLLTMLLRTLSLSFLWPGFHWVNITLIDESTRGKFLGNLQALMMGSLLLGPLLSGIFIDFGYSSYILLAAGFLYFCSFMASLSLPVSKEQNPVLPNFSETKKFCTTQTLEKHFFQASIVEAVQTSSLLLVYPILLQLTLKSYTVMGGMFFVMAGVEILSAKFFGHLTDKYSSKKMIQWGAFARFLDIAPRGLLALFPSAFFAGVLSVSAGILGPLFGVSFYAQIYARAEKSENVYAFIVTREWILGVARFLFFVLTALCFSVFGIYALGFALFLAGVLSFLLKKM